MTTKNKVIISVVALVTAFACGRFSVQKPQVKTTETVDENTETKQNQNTHKVTTITKSPDGKEVTTIVEDTNSNTDKKKNEVENVSQTITPPKIDTYRVTALAGFDLLHNFKPSYGAAVSYRVLGPIEVSAFGLTNSVVGLGVGLSF